MRKGRTFVPIQKSADYTLTLAFIDEYAGVVATASEKVFTMPSPGGNYDDKEVVFLNYSSGWNSIVCNDGFPDGSDVILIAPGEEIRLTCEKVSSTAYRWMRQKYDDLPKWSTWTPTLAWTTATPADVDITARYQLSQKTGLCKIDIEITLGDDDGAGATDLTITPPPGCYPQDVDAYIPLSASQSVAGAVPTNPVAFIDCLHNTAASRLIQFQSFAECTDNKSLTLRVSGAYPVWGATTYTPVGAYTTGTPTQTSIVGLYTIDNNICYTWMYQVLSDGKGCTAATYTPPLPVKDVNAYVSGEGFELVDTTYSDPMPYLDATNDTMASRLMGFKSFTTMTDAKGAAIALSLAWEVDGWYAYTPVEVWDTAPASWASVMRYMIDRPNRLCHFVYSGTSADGNGNAANELTIPLPVVPKYGTNVSVLSGYQLVDTTANKPAPKIIHSTTAGRSRAVIGFDDLSAMTDSKTATVYVAGFFEID